MNSSNSRQRRSSRSGKGKQPGKSPGKSGSRSGSSDAWLREHHDDIYVQRAKSEGYCSRAVYKLIELDQREGLLKPGMTIVELGAAPGSWTQYCAERIGADGTIVASDILPLSASIPHETVNFIQGDFNTDTVLAKIADTLGDKRADLVLSDMAPNLSGVASSDQARSMGLFELAHDLAARFGRPGSDFVAKLFQGEGFDQAIKCLRNDYTKVSVRKPEASRNRSREVFAVARNLLLV